MLSLTGFIFSCRMQLRRLYKHKFAIGLSLIMISATVIWGPTAYQESLLDPFSTLNMPNRALHPGAINKLGMIHSEDPFHPYYYTNEGKIRELMRDLQRATPLSSSEQASLNFENEKINYFTLHRESSKYHDQVDYALQYYPEKGIVRFGQQLFRINEASIYAFTQITNGMTSGWWK